MRRAGRGATRRLKLAPHPVGVGGRIGGVRGNGRVGGRHVERQKLRIGALVRRPAGGKRDDDRQQADEAVRDVHRRQA